MTTGSPSTRVSSVPLHERSKPSFTSGLSMAHAALCCALLASLSAATHAAECASLETEAPHVVTLMVSARNASVGLIVRPDCSFEEISATRNPSDGALEFYAQSKGIERVVSYPRVERLDLSTNRIQDSDMSEGTTATTMSLVSNQLSSLDGIKFPPSLQTLQLGMNNFTKMEQIAVPSSITTLYIVPNTLRDAKFRMPPQLEKLDLSTSKITSLEGLVFNDKITSFTCYSCPITTIAGIRFPPNLKYLYIDSSTIENFEISESDVETVRELVPNAASSKLTACSDPTATLVKLPNGFNVCVVSDARFQAKYGGLFSLSDSASGSAESASSGSASEEAPTNSSRQESSSSSRSSSSRAQDVISTASPRIPSPETEGSQAMGEVTTARSLFTSQPFVFSVGTGSVIVIAVVVNIARRRKRLIIKDGGVFGSPLLDEPSHTQPETFNSPGMAGSQLINDDLLPFQLFNSELVFIRELGRSDMHLTQLAKLNGRTVVTKQLAPEHAEDSFTLWSFVETIKTAVQLDHPQLVEFIGISYTTQHTFTAVVELLPRGDLRSILFERSPSLRDWFQASHNMKPKLEIAMDVAQAMTYLHSFQPQIFYGELSARKVFLDERGGAKLSCLGIGTYHMSPTTAPEVLQGEPFSASADVFAFGRLLVDLDRCDDNNNAGDALTATCPEGIRRIVARCLDADPAARPSFMELHYELSKLRQQPHC